MPGLVSPGFKRKHDALEEDEGKGCHPAQAYTMQRQGVLNISICKLKKTRAIPEPSLRRSVLICNTLRKIELELRAEGRHFDSNHLSMIIANQSVEENADEEILSSATADTNNSSSGAPLVALNCQRIQESCLAKECIYSRKGDINSASSPTDLLSRTMCGCSGCLSSSPRLTSPAVSLKSNHPKVHSFGAKDSSLRLPSKQDTSFTSLPLDVLDPEESFGDIDIAMYDFDLNSPVYGVSNCRSDLVDELDQIMHVLVDVGM